jgi:hypothetical protein
MRGYILVTSRVPIHRTHDAKHAFRASRIYSQPVVSDQDATTTNKTSHMYIYICICPQWHGRVSFLHCMFDGTRKYRHLYSLARDHQYYRNRPLSTRRDAFTSSSHQQRTQPSWACSEERESVRVALSLSWPVLGIRYRAAERHSEGQRLSAEA